MVSTRHATYRKFMQRLRDARLKAGLSQKQVAERLKQPQSYVSRCESGERRVDVVEAMAFAEIYGVTLDDLLPEIVRKADDRD